MPQQTITLHTRILVIGAGTFGCSSALHLARCGYKHVKVLDAHTVPSPISAGNDINKIVEIAPQPSEGSNDYVSEQLNYLAGQGWVKDPIFQPYYHDTGFIPCANTPDGIKQLMETELKDADEFEMLETPEDFRATMPSGVLMGDFSNWKGGWKIRGAGWVFARGALVAAFHEAEKLGVVFVTGSRGAVTQLLKDDTSVLGALTSDGTRHLADLTILANGAQAPNLLDFENQLRPTAWTLAHIQLTTAECELYKDLPVLYNLENGFFMEPDTSRGELKICDEHPGYTNFVHSSNGDMSVPFAKLQVPVEAENRIRSFLQDTMPHLANREFTFARICWCADTVDRKFLLDWYPKRKGLVLVVGGSGHGFQHITSIGTLVRDLLDDKLEERLKEALRWRPGTAVGRDWGDVQGRRGAENRVMDFKEVEEWTSVPAREGWESVLQH